MNINLYQKIKSILKNQATICLSTSSKQGQPESALVYYVLDEQLDLCFLTKELTEKGQNLQENPKVSLLAFDEAKKLTLQIKGVAEQISQQSERNHVFDKLLHQTVKHHDGWPPPIGKVDMGKVIIYKVSPTWIRLGDFKADGKQVFEQLLG